MLSHAVFIVSMETQNQIKRKLSQPEAIEHICKLIDASDSMKITRLADELCEQFAFYNPLGKKQRAGCLKALRELEHAKLIVYLFAKDFRQKI